MLDARHAVWIVDEPISTITAQAECKCLRIRCTYIYTYYLYLYYAKYFQREIKVIYAELPIITFSIWTFGGQLTRTLAPSSHSQAPQIYVERLHRQRQYGEMENCLGHTIIMATVLSWSIPPGCVETFLTLYLHTRCSWDVWAVLSPSCGQQRGCAAQVPAGGLRPDREVSSITIHSAPSLPSSHVQASPAAQRVPGGGVRSRTHTDHRRGEERPSAELFT